MKLEYLSESDVEVRAEQILEEYERRSGRPLTFPVPIERIVDQILDLPVLWEPIPSQGGRIHPSKLVQPTLSTPGHIVLNEDLLASKFRDHPGLERTALAHEAGHGVFHLDHAAALQLGLGFTIPNQTSEFVSDAESLTDGFARAIAMRGPVGDHWCREWQAHTFMRFVLMPRRLLLALLEGRDYRRWRGAGGLYDLRDRLDVTISALTVHLEKLRIVRVDKEGVIRDLAPAAKGQRSLAE